MDRFRMIQIAEDNSRLELYDGNKSLGIFNTPKMAKFYIDDILRNEQDIAQIKKTVDEPIKKQRGRPRK